MRMKTLILHHLNTTKFALTVFYTIFLAGSIIGTIIAAATDGSVTIMGSISEPDGASGSSISIFSYFIFVLVVMLISAQSDTRFLITRSVSRKEIFLSNVINMIPFAAILSVLQIIGIYMTSFTSHLLGGKFNGLSSDIQVYAAPDTNNIFLFFLVSFSMIIGFSSASYLLGSLFAKWRYQTIIVLGLIGITIVSSSFPTIATKIVEIFKDLYMDESSGIYIVLKQLGISIVLLLITFPIMRRITAGKKV